MKQILNSVMLAAMLMLTATACNGQNDGGGTEVLLETSAGNIRIRLYDDTPLHRDNFIQNVRDGKYDGVLFHRIIRNFMIQTGDPDTRPGYEADLEAANEGTASPNPTIEAEIRFPQHFHRRGVVAAAREGTETNPTRASDAYQFYIVTGKFQNEQQLATIELARKDAMIERRYQELMVQNDGELTQLRRDRNMTALSNRLEKLLDQARAEIDELPESSFQYTSQMQRAYRSAGGAPWLDGDYTIFGEVVEGMKVVLDIEKARTDGSDRPLKDYRIFKARVLE